MKTLNSLLVIAISLILGGEVALAEKLVVPKDQRKQTQSQGGGDTGGGQYMTTPTIPVHKEMVLNYIQNAKFYLPYVMRFVDQFFQLRREESVLAKINGKIQYTRYSEEDYKKYIERYHLFASTRDHNSIYEVLQILDFVVQDKCWDKDGVEVAASVYNVKANEVCVSLDKVLDKNSELDSGNVIVSLVALFAHELAHKAGVREEEGANWVQSIVLTHFKPTQNTALGFKWNAQEILQIIENRNKANESVLLKAKRSLRSACFQYGFNFVYDFSGIDSKMYEASKRGMSYLSYESYVDFLTAMHILILSTSFCLDDEDMREMMDPRDEHGPFLSAKPGQQYLLPARREPGTLSYRAIETVKVGIHDIESLKRIYGQSDSLLSAPREELRELLKAGAQK